MRTDIKTGQSPIERIEQGHFRFNGSPSFEVVDENGRPLMPDLFDTVMNWINTKQTVSKADMAKELAHVAVNKIREKVSTEKYSDVPEWAKLNSGTVYSIMSILMDAIEHKHENKEWRFRERVPIQIGHGFEDHNTGLRSVVIEFDQSSGQITLMPDWSCGEKMFRRFKAGGIESEKSKIWRENLKYNQDKTGFENGIKKYQGKGRGKTAIICGNGPSLRRNGDLLKKHPNAIVLGCNSALRMFKEPETIFDYYCIVDHNTTDKTKAWLFHDDGKPRHYDGEVLGCVTALTHLADRFGDKVNWFTGSDMIGGLAEKFSKSEYDEKKMRIWVGKNGYEWDEDVTEHPEYWEVMTEAKWARKLGWVADSKSVLNYLMHFAWATLEVDSIVLIGADFASSPDGFWTATDKNVYIPDMEAVMDIFGYACFTRPAYQTARRQCDISCMFLTDSGVPVINASQGGTLRWWMHTTLENVYKKLDEGPDVLKPWAYEQMEKLSEESKKKKDG